MLLRFTYKYIAANFIDRVWGKSKFENKADKGSIWKAYFGLEAILFLLDKIKPNISVQRIQLGDEKETLLISSGLRQKLLPLETKSRKARKYHLVLELCVQYILLPLQIKLFYA